ARADDMHVMSCRTHGMDHFLNVNVLAVLGADTMMVKNLHSSVIGTVNVFRFRFSLYSRSTTSPQPRYILPITESRKPETKINFHLAFFTGNGPQSHDVDGLRKLSAQKSESGPPSSAPSQNVAHNDAAP